MKITKINTAPDYLKLRLKVKDIDSFDFSSVNNLFKCKPKLLVIENPGYDNFEKHVSGLRYLNWSQQNLHNHGYEVSKPVGTSLDSYITLYALYSKKVQTKFLRKFSGKSNVFNDYNFDELGQPKKKAPLLTRLMDNVIGSLERSKTNSDTDKAYEFSDEFAKSVEYALRDVSYDQEVEVLYQDALYKLANARFMKMLDKFDGVRIHFTAEKPVVNQSK